MSEDGLSPHYFIVWQRGYQPSRSEHEGAVRRAHRAVRYLAALDQDHAQIANKERGTYLVREGDEVDACIVLLSGFIYRSKFAASGARQILSIHVRGDLVDLQNSILKIADHNVQTLTRVEVAYISRSAMLEVAVTHPGIALALWRDTLIDGSVFREWILNVGHRSARQRICHLLCEIVVRQEAAGLTKGPEYQWPMTQDEIGDATGLTNVHVNRTIKRLKADGLFTTNMRSVTILDWLQLQDAGDFTSAYLHQPVPRARHDPVKATETN
ncbi:MAG: Crp/Fnr family transcriptional regulator [Spirochaetia bacterium]|nr:MAG: Crp/Fnr family transcriptional regulator [Spirochaetia bacterium]